MSNVTKLPSAATSYYTANKAGRYFDVVLVTPCGRKSIKTRLTRHPDRASALAHGEEIADQIQRAFKGRAVE